MSEGRQPRVGVVICECGQEIAGAMDVNALQEHAARLPGVIYASCEAYPCSKDGQARLEKTIVDLGIERVMVAGCTMRLVNKLFGQTMERAGLDHNFLDVRNIREHCVYVHPKDTEAAFQKAKDLIEMGVARLGMLTPQRIYSGGVIKKAVVIGSGLSGLTSAITLADNGIEVVLVEPTGTLGSGLHPLQTRAHEMIAESVTRVSQHTHISKLLNARVTEVTGQPGNYQVSVTQGEKTTDYDIGIIVVATSAHPKSLGENQWYDRQRVKTQAEFEAELSAAANTPSGLGLQDIVMVLYADEVEGGRCSPLNCMTSLNQAIWVKELNPGADVTILFRDLYLGSVGDAGEDSFLRARESGVTFFRYQEGYPPVIGNQTVDVYDALTGDSVKIPFDRVVLSMPLIPQANADTLAALLRLPQDDLGFIVEPRVRLRPGRYADDGIYVLGGAHQPADLAETLFQAYVTSARVLRFLSQETIHVESPIAEIDSTLCTGCGNCAQVCPASAINLEKTDGILSLSEVNELRCTGCGNCVVVCPVRAISMPGWNDAAILAQISAALRTHPLEMEGKPYPVPRVVALACEWSAYAAADIAGARRFPYPAHVRIVRMNCSARFDPNHILWAFLNGADGVFLGACHPGECHYGTGNLYAKERVEVLKKQLAEHGIDPRRLRLEFLAGDDGAKFAEVISHFVDDVFGELATRMKIRLR